MSNDSLPAAPEGASVSIDVSRRRRSALGRGAFAFGVMAIVAAVVAHWVSAFGPVVGFAITGAVLVGTFRGRIFPTFRSFGRKAAIRSAHIDDEEASILRLADGRDLRIATGDLLASAALVEDCGFAPKRVRHVRLLSLADVGSSFARILGALGLTVTSVVGSAALVSLVSTIANIGRHGAMGVALVAFVVTLLSFAVASAFAGFFRAGEAVVGADGVLIRSLLAPSFIPYTRIRRVTTSGGGVRLELYRGPSVELPVSFLGYAYAHSKPSPSDVDAVAAQIRRGIASLRPASESAKLDDLDRGDRSAETWREAMAGLGERGPGYRGAAIDDEELLAVAEDASAPPERRVGAALALRAWTDDTHRRRVRIAAASSADGDMRAALEAAAEGEIAETELTRAALKRALS